ncbi:MAG: MlaD family protein [Thermoleophilaceae bacterium]
MRRLIAAAGVLALVVGAAVLTATKDSTPAGTTYKIVFDNAFGLTEGGDFRVGGVNAGKTTKFRATSSEPPKAEVTAQITRPGFDDLRKDATCNIKPQSLIGEYYVDCQSGSRAKPSIKPGGTVPVNADHFDHPPGSGQQHPAPPLQGAAATGHQRAGHRAGRPAQGPAVGAQACPSRPARDQQDARDPGRPEPDDRQLHLRLRHGGHRAGGPQARGHPLHPGGGDTASITATRREALRQTFRKLPGFLDELTPTMRRLGQLTDEQIPLLADAQRAAPSLDTFLGRLGPFADASRPALKSLGKTSVQGTKAFRDGAQEIRELKRLAANAPATAKPLRQFLASLDDRRRAIDGDPRGKVGGPPADDISNKGQANNGGFTGLESFWSYFFWQTLALNNFDSVSHVLRVGLTLTECSPLENRTLQSNPELKAKFDKCNSYLGPNQPGVTTPDFTRGARAASVSRQADKPALKAGERRSAGQPDAGPVAGQKDVSKPQVTLPPAVKKLVDSLPKLPEQTKRQIDSDKVDRLLSGKGPQSQSGSPPSSQQLLDYLMAP